MKRGHRLKLVLFGWFLFLLLPTSGVAQGKVVSSASDSIKNIHDGKPYMEVYNGEGKVVKSYSEEEMDELKQDIIASDIYKVPEDEEFFSYSLDANGHMISAGNKKVLKRHRAGLVKVKAANLSVYNYEETEFHGHIWIGQGRDYNKPQNIVVDMKSKFSRMKIQLLHEEQEIGSVKIGNFVGVLNIPVASLTEQIGNVKIKFVNESEAGTSVSLHGGQVYYK
ncbi:hypothetical protein ACO11K_002293 [Bacillus cytotoxicus]|uniref:hypothetical protein n=1 Tax=Bacillus cereus group sp. BfR-BA-01492 TaxID=2920361 RepID=UPI001F56D7E8|nr:hypothetical protein [Bacillus cereus group sp. BfR-BA-01492]EMA6343510.1 hypothetical protein [Bacillus cytotoxicus]